MGDHLSLEVTEVIKQLGQTIIKARYDGTYDEPNVPDPLVLASHFTVQANKIVSQITISPLHHLSEVCSASARLCRSTKVITAFGWDSPEIVEAFGYADPVGKRRPRSRQVLGLTVTHLLGRLVP